MGPGKRRKSVVALIVAGCATLGAVAPGASAATTTTCTPLSLQGKDQLRCVTTTVTTTTNQVVTETNDVVVTTEPVTEITKVTRFVPSTQTVFERTNTTGPCQVGESGRVGTAPGFETQEVLVTTTQEFLDTTTKTFDVTTTRTFLVTTTQTFPQDHHHDDHRGLLGQDPGSEEAAEHRHGDGHRDAAHEYRRTPHADGHEG